MNSAPIGATLETGRYPLSGSPRVLFFYRRIFAREILPRDESVGDVLKPADCCCIPKLNHLDQVVQWLIDHHPLCDLIELLNWADRLLEVGYFPPQGLSLG
jgi:hypothetical protein